MTTTAQKAQASAALAELQTFLPVIRKTFYVARQHAGSHFINAFPPIPYGQTGYIPGQPNDMSPPVTDAILARIEAGIVTAQAVVSEAEAV